MNRRLSKKSFILFVFLLIAKVSQANPVALSQEDFPEFPAEQINVGRLLFYDPILSGNKNISCATCHHPRFATSDALSLGIGEGGTGIGPARYVGSENTPEQRISRNSPALFNLGHKDVTVFFHDGRIEVDRSRPSGFRTPLEDDMVEGFASLLSAQTMFPVLSADEMAGHYQENDVSTAVRQGRITGEAGAWHIIANRVNAIPEYRRYFRRFDSRIASGESITFVDISDAIAAFVTFEWRADQTAYDNALRGGSPLSPNEKRGQDLFFGSARCSTCHAGPLLSDQSFHAMALPQLGPGKLARFESHQRDDGRFRITGNEHDQFAFRTPMLRNVIHTGPWGHAGAHSDLLSFLKYHTNPVEGITTYKPQVTLVHLPDAVYDWAIMEDVTTRNAIRGSYKGRPVELNEADFDALMAFLGALTDNISLAGRLGIPEKVPSGLRIDR